MREHQIVITLKSEQFQEVQRLSKSAGAKSMGLFVRQKLLKALGIEVDGRESEVSKGAVLDEKTIEDLRKIQGELKAFVAESMTWSQLTGEAVGQENTADSADLKGSWQDAGAPRNKENMASNEAPWSHEDVTGNETPQWVGAAQSLNVGIINAISGPTGPASASVEISEEDDDQIIEAIGQARSRFEDEEEDIDEPIAGDSSTDEEIGANLPSNDQTQSQIAVPLELGDASQAPDTFMEDEDDPLAELLAQPMLAKKLLAKTAGVAKQSVVVEDDLEEDLLDDQVFDVSLSIDEKEVEDVEEGKPPANTKRTNTSAKTPGQIQQPPARPPSGGPPPRKRS